MNFFNKLPKPCKYFSKHENKSAVAYSQLAKIHCLLDMYQSYSENILNEIVFVL